MGGWLACGDCVFCVGYGCVVGVLGCCFVLSLARFVLVLVWRGVFVVLVCLLWSLAGFVVFFGSSLFRLGAILG